ncbi:MAG: RNA polymerase sigma-70 factor [Ginsengibacter sp.]
MQQLISNEKNLLISLVKGSEKAFEELYNLYSAPLLGFIFNIVKSKIHAGEILQETFIKVWNNREKIDPDQPFRAYLFQITKNNIYDFFRQAAKDKKLELLIIKNVVRAYSHVEELLTIKDDVNLLNKMIDALPPKRRQIFKLVKIEELSYAEVSEKLHISVSTINDHVVKATKFIHANLASHPVRVFILLGYFLYS